MEFKLTVVLHPSEELSALVKNILTGFADDARQEIPQIEAQSLGAETSEPETKERKPRKTSQAKELGAPYIAPAPAQKEEPEAKEAPKNVSTVSLETIKQLATEKVKKNQPAVSALIKETFKVEALSALKQEDYASFYEQLQAI